ncbi:MAG: hypothetical protein IKG55_08035, partial [Solobacterium sp.]|nr:hypothetical protein [Solobacterium sp.]
LAAVPIFSGRDLQENLRKISRYAQEAARKGARLFLTPEASLTGYFPRETGILAIEADSKPVLSIIGLAARTGLIISCGFMERTLLQSAQGDSRTAFFLTQLITDGKQTQFYRKTHPGCLEGGVFSLGNELPVYESDAAVIGTHLCWESHIPDIGSVFRRKGAELFLVPYASGMSGEKCRNVWSRHLPARAWDNGVYVAACNALRFRQSSSLSADQEQAVIGGGCAIYDPKGLLIASDFSLEEKLLVCDLSPDKLQRNYPVKDMRHISYFDRRRPELY